MASRKFDDYLHEKLRDPEYAQVFMETAYDDDGISGFLVAMKEVLVAQEGGLREAARRSGRSRTSLYKSLREGGDPRLSTVESLLETVGMELRPVRKANPATSVNA